MTRIHISAPGIHTGGGAVLLRELLRAGVARVGHVHIDSRFPDICLTVSAGAEVRIVHPTISSRLAALRALQRIGLPGDVLLCFNGLAPARRTPGVKIVSFVHAPYLAGLLDTASFPVRTRLRFAFEQALFRRGLCNTDEIWCQTEAMRRALARNLLHLPVKIRPFLAAEMIDRLASVQQQPRSNSVARRYIYPADGSAHKNHETLYAAWNILAEKGCHPELVLTIENALHETLLAEFAPNARGLICVGKIPHSEVLDRLSTGSSLIFPSLAETYGLPLIEAASMRADILAPELDYVRDICVPTHCFDARSPVSIARAVMRHCGIAEPQPLPFTPAAFLRSLFEP